MLKTSRITTSPIRSSSTRFPGEFDTVGIDGDEPFFVERADCLFECFFTDAKQGVDIFRWAFVGNGNTAPKLLYCFQNIPGNIINFLIAWWLQAYVNFEVFAY